MAAEAVLAAREVVGGYTDLDILHGASVEVHPREVVCIVGPNGAGKSTLLKAIFGLVKVRSGEIRLLGKEITRLPPDKVVAHGVAYVPQVQNVFPNLTVRENLEMGAFLRRDPIEPTIERVLSIFPDLKPRMEEKVGRFSGGQRQMVAFGRALMLEPKVLLLDEPSAGLAPALQNQVFERVRAIADAGTPALLVEQNVRGGLAIADRGYVLDMGRNKFAGKAAELLGDDRLGKLYLGR